MEQRKKTSDTSIASWLVNRDPGFLAYYNPYVNQGPRQPTATWRIIPHLVDSNYGDRKSPNWGYGTPSVDGSEIRLTS